MTAPVMHPAESVARDACCSPDEAGSSDRWPWPIAAIVILLLAPLAWAPIVAIAWLASR